MPQPSLKSRPAIATLLALALASLLLAACGSSSSSSSTASTSASASKTATSPARSAFAHRFAATRECMQKNGITLPKRTPGQSPGAGFGGSGGLTLPKGMTRAQYQAIVQKCGGFAGGRFPSAGSRLSSPVFKQALAKFGACMRENGENVPTPNTSGKGPIFNTKGLNTTSARFKSAQTKCSATLRRAFRGAPGASPGGAPGAPPTSAG